MKEERTSYIGMFDSGIGGLTVMQQLIHKLPYESIIYYGDTARIPYGGKSRETIVRYSIENTIFLLEKNIKLLVVACNTASALALPKLREIFNIPVIGVVEPGAEKAISVTKSKRIGVLGTKGTIESGAYQNEIKRLLPDAVVVAKACPLFVPLVEEKFLEHEATKLIVKEYLAPLKQENIDTLLLGCTHYPLLRHLIEEEIGSHVTVVDSANTCSEKVAQILIEKKIGHDDQKSAFHEYFVSDDPTKFKALAEKLFGHCIDQVSIHIHHH